MTLFAGLDVSTQSCKLVVIDHDSHDVVHADAVAYDEDLPEFGTRHGIVPDQPAGVAESDPLMWIASVERVFDRLRASAVPVRDIACVSVSGQQHGLVALRSDGSLARRTAKLWHDTSTHEECEDLTRALGGLEAMIRQVGNSQRPGYTAGKILHFKRHEPDAFAQTATLFLVHNYVNWYLTGGIAAMEPGDTSGMALWHPGDATWSSAVLDAIDPSLAQKLPPIAPSDRSIGHVSRPVAERLGLSPTCVVDAGCGDNMYGAVGTGNVQPGIVTASLGTSGTAYTFLDEPFIDSTGEIAAFCDSTGHYLPLVCVSNLANGYDDTRKSFGLTHEQYSDIVLDQPPANGGRMIIPWYESERTPDVPLGGATMFGFGPDDWRPDAVGPAVVTGHVLNLYMGFSRLGVRPDEIRLTGGMSRSPAWCQTIADIFDAPAVPVEGEGAALGAALHAAWVWKREHAGERASVDEIVEPFVSLDAAARRNPRAGLRPTFDDQRILFDTLSRRLRDPAGEDPFALRARLKT